MAPEISSPDGMYRLLIKRKILIVALLLLALVVLFLINIAVGSTSVGLSHVVRVLIAPGSVDGRTLFIVRELRLPMALMAIVAGGGLAAAGAIMQTILNNPLASPYTLGISAASGFGAALAIVCGVGLLPLGMTILVPVNAFAFSVATSFLILLLSKRRMFNAEGMVLAGIGILFLFHSAMALLQYFAAEDELQSIVFWMFGSLSKTTWPRLLLASAVFLAILPLLYREAWNLTKLRLGDEKAKSLGINVERLRLKMLLYGSVLTGVMVAFVGTIGFVGLASPHLARMMGGEDQRFFIPLSVLCGSLLLSGASILSKLVFPGVIFPIGIITSLIGVPFLLALVLKSKRRFW